MMIVKTKRYAEENSWAIVRYRITPSPSGSTSESAGAISEQVGVCAGFCG